MQHSSKRVCEVRGGGGFFSDSQYNSGGIHWSPCHKHPSLCNDIKHLLSCIVVTSDIAYSMGRHLQQNVTVYIDIQFVSNSSKRTNRLHDNFH